MDILLPHLSVSDTIYRSITQWLNAPRNQEIWFTPSQYESITDTEIYEHLPSFFRKRVHETQHLINGLVQSNDISQQVIHIPSHSDGSDVLELNIVYTQDSDLMIIAIYADRELGLFYTGDENVLSGLLKVWGISLDMAIRNRLRGPRRGKFGFEKEMGLIYNMLKLTEGVHRLPKHLEKLGLRLGNTNEASLIELEAKEHRTVLSENKSFPTDVLDLNFIIFQEEPQSDIRWVIVYKHDESQHHPITSLYRLENGGALVPQFLDNKTVGHLCQLVEDALY